MTKEIIEGNKMIAEFMGGSPIDEGFEFENTPVKFERRRLFHWDDISYNYSWDWLMPVVEKIELLGWSWQPSVWRKDNTISNYQSLFTHSKEKAVSGESKVKIESVWLAVVDFIKWHNSLTSK